jgi:hypothetical protein
LLHKKPDVNLKCRFNEITPLEYVIKNDLGKLGDFSVFRKKDKKGKKETHKKYEVSRYYLLQTSARNI